MAKCQANNETSKAEVPVPTVGIPEIAIEDIIPTPENPRKIKANDTTVKELSESIKVHGVLQPLLARVHPTEPGKYDLRAGERRYRAAKLAGLATVPVIVREMSDDKAKEITAIENLQRENLSPMENARGIALMHSVGHTYEEIAARIGKSASWVARAVSLTNLCKEFVKAADGADKRIDLSGWSVSHLEMIARFPKGTQELIFGTVIKTSWETEKMQKATLSELREAVGRWMRLLKGAPWKLSDLSCGPSCDACNKRSSCQPELFQDLQDTKKNCIDDVCLDKKCWDEKEKKFLKSKHDSLSKSRKIPVIPEYQFQEDDAKDVFPGANILNAHGYANCKKSDPGAMQAFTYGGNSQGKLKWVRPINSSLCGNVGGPKSLAQRREQLGLRRQCATIEAVIKQAREFSQDASVGIVDNLYESIRIVSLAVHFGVAGLPREYANYREVDSWPLHKAATAQPSPAAFDNLILGLYRQVVETLIGKIGNVAILKNLDDSMIWAERVCRLTRLDIDAIAAQVAEDMPEPKAWKKLELEEQEKAAVANDDQRSYAPDETGWNDERLDDDNDADNDEPNLEAEEIEG